MSIVPGIPDLGGSYVWPALCPAPCQALLPPSHSGWQLCPGGSGWTLGCWCASFSPHPTAASAGMQLALGTVAVGLPRGLGKQRHRTPHGHSCQCHSRMWRALFGACLAVLPRLPARCQQCREGGGALGSPAGHAAPPPAPLRFSTTAASSSARPEAVGRRLLPGCDSPGNAKPQPPHRAELGGPAGGLPSAGSHTWHVWQGPGTRGGGLARATGLWQKWQCHGKYGGESWQLWQGFGKHGRAAVNVAVPWQAWQCFGKVGPPQQG